MLSVNYSPTEKVQEPNIMNYVLIQIVKKNHSKFTGYVKAAYLANLVIFINSTEKISENVTASGRKSVTNSLPDGR
jgi:UDP-glucose 6-dehydrogenase